MTPDTELARLFAEVCRAEGDSRLTIKQAWWAGYRAGKGLPHDMPRARIQTRDRIRIHLGTFTSEEMAYEAYKRAKKIWHDPIRGGDG